MVLLTEYEASAGVHELRQELDRNPDGDHGRLEKAQQWRNGNIGVRPKLSFLTRSHVQSLALDVLQDMLLNGSVKEKIESAALVLDTDSAVDHPQFSSESNFSPMGAEAKGQPLADYICVRQDRYRDELQCPKCSGKGHSLITCRSCDGQGTIATVSCPDCISSDFDSPALPKSTGFVPCAQCKGTGQQTAGVTGVVTTTDTKDQPSTGIIVSLGRNVTEFSLGDRVLYSKFAGVTYEAEGRTWVVMKQTYPIMRILGTGDVKTKES